MNTRIERTENCPGMEGSNGLLGHPDDVVRDPGMTLDEKRAVLAAWASDAHGGRSGRPGSTTVLALGT